MFDSGSPLLTRSSNGPVRFAINSGRVPTLLPMHTFALLLSTAALTLLLRWKGVPRLAGEGFKSADTPGTSPEKLDVPPLLLAARGIFVRPLHSVVYPSVCFKGEPSVQSPLQVVCPLR